jgi:hypothetical protein
MVVGFDGFVHDFAAVRDKTATQQFVCRIDDDSFLFLVPEMLDKIAKVI